MQAQRRDHSSTVEACFHFIQCGICYVHPHRLKVVRNDFMLQQPIARFEAESINVQGFAHFKPSARADIVHTRQ
jgi:hypothetical protein